ncbi:MAG TPA: phage protease [Terriglobia bacterium]|nr:phage protease [Terracidiphilus sp.]HZT69563.1 phage protease [Terriglobia bacterium]
MVTKKEADGEHPSSHYLVVEDPEKPTTWHLRVKGTDGKPDHRLMGAAWAALHKGYRGNKYEGPNKAEALRKLTAMYHAEGLDLPSETSSEDPRQVFELSDLAAHARIPIAVTGEWVKSGRKFSITPKHLAEIKRNFERRQVPINVDYDHASEQPEVALGGPIPSAGELVAIEGPETYVDPRGNTRQILWGRFDPTDRARALVRAREYRYVSPAIDFNAKSKETGEPLGAALTTVALTNRPFLEEMPQVRLSDPEFQLMDSNIVHVPGNISSPQSAGKGGKVKTYKVKKLADGEHKGKYAVFEADGGEPLGLAEVEPDEDDNQKASEALLSEIGCAGLKLSEVKALVERGAAVNHETKLLSEIVDAKGRIEVRKLDELTDSGKVKPSATRRALEAEKKAQDAFAAGKIKAADLQAATRLALSDADAFDRFIANAAAAVPLGEQGTAGESASGAANAAWSEKLEKRAAELLNLGKAKDPERALQLAEYELIHTPDGLQLYEMARKERIEAAKR